MAAWASRQEKNNTMTSADPPCCWRGASAAAAYDNVVRHEREWMRRCAVAALARRSCFVSCHSLAVPLPVTRPPLAPGGRREAASLDGSCSRTQSLHTSWGRCRTPARGNVLKCAQLPHRRATSPLLVTAGCPPCGRLPLRQGRGSCEKENWERYVGRLTCIAAADSPWVQGMGNMARVWLPGRWGVAVVAALQQLLWLPLCEGMTFHFSQTMTPLDGSYTGTLEGELLLMTLHRLVHKRTCSDTFCLS